jgi:protein involved in polysaccharide export with SLBB domain
VPAPRSEDERLYPGDAVVFKVDEDPPTAQPRVEVMAVVQEDFTVTWLSNKVFTTTGKTYEEFRQEVHDYYVPVLFKNVRLMATDPPFYIVCGEVWSPGFRILYRPTTVLKAIESAGGFTPSANKKKVQLIGVDRERRIINCTNVRRLEEDVEVARGDKIYVPPSPKWLFW